MSAWYNEIDPYAAAWLRNLIAAGLIAPGVVDERSIEDVHPSDLVGFTQCHFFAGIGVWSRALRLAGWPDDRSVWTGSCPCQPFSVAGAGRADADARHLWPAWFRLIRECRPAVVFGEQVGAAIGVGWLDDVFVSLESLDYACGAVDFPACSVGAPHIRQRLYFVADADGKQFDDQIRNALGGRGELADRGLVGHAVEQGLEGHGGDGDDRDEPGRLGAQSGGSVAAAGAVGGFWTGAVWLPCTDGKARAVEPGTFPLVAGAPARVGRLRAYGNAIVAPAAAEFIRAVMLECRPSSVPPAGA